MFSSNLSDDEVRGISYLRLRTAAAGMINAAAEMGYRDKNWKKTKELKERTLSQEFIHED